MEEVMTTNETRLRRLRTDLKLKQGDLKVIAGRLRRAQDFEQHNKVAKLQSEFCKIKETIDDVKRAIVELEGEKVQDDADVFVAS